VIQLGEMPSEECVATCCAVTYYLEKQLLGIRQAVVTKKMVSWTQATNSACSDSVRVNATRRRSNVHEVHNPIKMKWIRRYRQSTKSPVEPIVVRKAGAVKQNRQENANFLVVGSGGLQSRIFYRQERQERQGNADNGHFLWVFSWLWLCSSPGGRLSDCETRDFRRFSADFQ